MRWDAQTGVVFADENTFPALVLAFHVEGAGKIIEDQQLRLAHELTPGCCSLH